MRLKNKTKQKKSESTVADNIFAYLKHILQDQARALHFVLTIEFSR